jgi:hypothetical protein
MTSTSLRAVICTPCGNYIWVGRCFGFNVRLDVEPLTLAEEIVAKLLKTRRTYATHRTAESFEVVPRMGAYIHIQGTPILGSHICDPSTFKFGATPPEDYWGRDKSKTYQGEEVPF